MNSRQRFLETLAFRSADRVPLFQEGMRKGVFRIWKKQGLESEAALMSRFHYDQREEIEPNLYPIPTIQRWPKTVDDLQDFRRHLDPQVRNRLPRHWTHKVRKWRTRDSALILNVHIGFFQSMGVEGWRRFEDAIHLTIDQPQLVRGMMKIQGEFAASMMERILQDVEVDAILISEPISSTHGPLISPDMYEDFVLSSYDPLLDGAEKFGIENIILRTYSNSGKLIPSIMKTRINCLWACECNHPSLDYRFLRQEYGNRLKLIGGIDRDVLLGDQMRIRDEVETKVPPLMEQGGYIPLLDGRIREVVPFANYVYYRKLLEALVIEGAKDKSHSL